MGERSASRNVYQLRPINDRAEVVAPAVPFSKDYISQKKIVTFVQYLHRKYFTK